MNFIILTIYITAVSQIYKGGAIYIQSDISEALWTRNYVFKTNDRYVLAPIKYISNKILKTEDKEKKINSQTENKKGTEKNKTQIKVIDEIKNKGFFPQLTKRAVIVDNSLQPQTNEMRNGLKRKKKEIEKQISKELQIDNYKLRYQDEKQKIGKKFGDFEQKKFMAIMAEKKAERSISEIAEATTERQIFSKNLYKYIYVKNFLRERVRGIEIEGAYRINDIIETTNRSMPDRLNTQTKTIGLGTEFIRENAGKCGLKNIGMSNWRLEAHLVQISYDNTNANTSNAAHLISLTNHIKRQIYWSFGLEAVNTINYLNLEDNENSLLYTQLAYIVDGIFMDVGFFKHSDISCDNDYSMWSYVLFGNVSNYSVNTTAVLASFLSLPTHLKRSLGPKIIRDFLEVSKMNEASIVWNSIYLSDDFYKTNYLEPNLSRNEKTIQSRIYQAIIDDDFDLNIFATPWALVKSIQSYISQQVKIEKEIIPVIRSMIIENKGRPVEIELIASLALVLISRNEFDAALDVISEYKTQIDRIDIRHRKMIVDVLFRSIFDDLPDSTVSMYLLHDVITEYFNLAVKNLSVIDKIRIIALGRQDIFLKNIEKIATFDDSPGLFLPGHQEFPKFTQKYLSNTGIHEFNVRSNSYPLHGDFRYFIYNEQPFAEIEQLYEKFHPLLLSGNYGNLRNKDALKYSRQDIFSNAHSISGLATLMDSVHDLKIKSSSFAAKIDSVGQIP